MHKRATLHIQPLVSSLVVKMASEEKLPWGLKSKGLTPGSMKVCTDNVLELLSGGLSVCSCFSLPYFPSFVRPVHVHGTATSCLCMGSADLE
jgi:hypothetical protein